MSIDNLVLIQAVLSIVVVVNVILALIIFSRGFPSIADTLFGLIALACAVWGIAIIGFYSSVTMGGGRWLLVSHSSALLIPLMFLIFSWRFPQKIVRRPGPIILVAVPAVVILYLLFATPFVVAGRSTFRYTIGPAYPLYSFLLIAYFVSGFLFLLKQLKETASRLEKKQAQYVLAGSLAAATLAIVPDLVLPYFHIFEYTWLGPLFTLLMVVSLFLAMLRYRLFNVKVILTEVASALIIVALLLELFFVQSPMELILKTVVLIILVIFSQLLIRSVYREVEQREKIEKLSEEKSEFMSFASHQVKGPLTNFKNATSMILQGDFGPVSDEMRGIIGNLYQTAVQAIPMVQGFLDISKLEQEGGMQYEMKETDLKAIAGGVVSEAKINAELKRLSLEYADDGAENYIVNADPIKIKEVVFNLVDNAVKYTPAGSVSVFLAKKDGKVRFSVKDSGVGIAPEDAERLFTKFGRGKDARRFNVSSSGLGLFLAKQIITGHNGRIWAESEGSGKGSTFSIELAAI